MRPIGAALRPWPTYMPLLLAVSVGVALGAAMLVDVPLRLKAVVGAAVGFATLLTVVQSPRRLLIFALSASLPFTVGKALAVRAGHVGTTGAVNVFAQDGLALALLLLLLVRLATTRGVGLRVSAAITVPAVAWLASGLLSLGNARDTQVAIFQFVATAKLLLMYLVLAASLQEEHDAPWLIAGVMVGMVLQSLLGLYQGITGQYAGLEFLGENTEVARLSLAGATATRCEGTMCHPNGLAMYLNTGLSFALALLLTRLPLRYRFLSLGLLALGLAVLVLTLSRGGWLGFVAAGGLVVALAVVTGRLKPTTAVLVAAVALAIVLAFGGDLVLRRLTANDRGSALSRVTMARGAVAIWSDYPIVGAGLNNYGLYMPQYDPASFQIWQQPMLVHNAYLLVGAETGVVGVTTFVWFLGAVMVTALRLARRARQELAWVAGAGVAGGYLALSLHSMGDYVLLGCLSLLTHLWLLAALVAGLAARAKTLPEPAR